jgi:hypothetical protein
MKVILTEKESEDMFYNALCNGMSELYCYGIRLKNKKGAYGEARQNLLKQYGEDACICLEDVWMQILRDGNELLFVDEEDPDDIKRIKLSDVHNKVCNTPINYLVEMQREEDDACTADAILQTVIYGEIIFG